MGCGCGKSREGTEEVKNRKRQSTMDRIMVGQTTGPINSAAQRRVSEYNQTLRDYMRRGR